jgi:hypothetical protein
MYMKMKGQAALEFLMTYGWAILVVLVVIGALAYFGVLNPSMLMPEKCTLQTGFSCKAHRVDATTNSISMIIQNGIGKEIIITGMNITAPIMTGYCEYNNTGRTSLGTGRELQVTLNCSSDVPLSQSKTRFDITMKYYNVDSSAAYSHSTDGELFARTEQ